jgi:tetratricopeptide (TPR) repeat protein
MIALPFLSRWRRLSLILFTLLALGATQPLHAQWFLQSGRMDEQIHRGIELIYNMKFVSADSVFDSVIAENPEHPAGYFYRATVMFWRAITNPDNTSFDQEYRAWLQKSVDRADTLLAHNSKDIAGLFYKGGSIGMRARIYEYRVGPNDAWDIMQLILSDAKKGVDYLNQLEDIIPDNSDILFGRGVYNYYVESEKEGNPTLAPVISAMFPIGNKTAGLQMLEMAAAHATYASVEAKFELMHIYYAQEHNYQRAYALAKELASKYPNNVQFLHYLGFAAYTENNVAQYDSIYRVMLDRSREKRDAYTIRQAREAMFFIGAAQMKKTNGNIDSALYYLYNSDLLSRKINQSGQQDWWVTDAEFYMGEAYDIRGDRKNATLMYERVLNLPDHNRDHADATRYLTSPYRR